MIRLALAGATGVFLLGLSAPAQAASPFDGTWKTDMKSVEFSKKPDVEVIKDGVYDCKSCTPPYSIKADGALHPVKDHPGMDEASLKVVDAHTVQSVERKGGRVVSTATISISPDGQTSTVAFVDTTNAGAPAVNGKVTGKRVAAGPPGSHIASGSWVTTSMADVSTPGLQMTMKLDKGMLGLSTPTGFSYTAKVDGGAAPVAGDPSITSVMVKSSGPNALVETDMRGAKVVSVLTMTLSPDGKVLTNHAENKETGRDSTFKAFKT